MLLFWWRTFGVLWTSGLYNIMMYSSVRGEGLLFTNLSRKFLEPVKMSTIPTYAPIPMSGTLTPKFKEVQWKVRALRFRKALIYISPRID